MPQLRIPGRPGLFGLAIPESWAVFDVANLQLKQARREAMAQAVGAQQRLSIDRLFEQARQVTRSARRAGAIWGAGTATVYDDGLFVAHVMVFAVAGRPGADFTTPMLSEAMGGQRSGAGAELPARRVLAVDLADGLRATRVTGQEEIEVAPGQKAVVAASYTFVPVPGTVDEYLLVMGISPNLAYEEEVLDLFDAIASTFTFYTARDGSDEQAPADAPSRAEG